MSILSLRRSYHLLVLLLITSCNQVRTTPDSVVSMDETTNFTPTENVRINCPPQAEGRPQPEYLCLQFNGDNLNAYNPMNALLSTHLSRLAYAKPDEIKTQLKTWGFGGRFPDESIKVVTSNKDIQFFVARIDNDVVLSFRGTIPTLNNYLTDASAMFQQLAQWDNRNVSIAETRMGEGHAGFIEALKGIRTQLIDALDAQGDLRTKGGPRLWITGHSLGGALATLAMAYVEKFGIRATALYTVGSPRVVSSNLRDYMQKLKIPIYRIVNSTDAVSGVLPLRFRHIGHTVIYKKDCARYEDPNETYFEELQRNWLKLSIPTHLNARYLECIERDLEGQP